MTKSKNETLGHHRLRRRAVQRIAQVRDPILLDDPKVASDPFRLVHELQVHKLELEMQNEELQRARSEREEVLRRYEELYELAPVGYLTLAEDGKIRQMNLTGACLLRMERSKLLGKPLVSLLAAESAPDFEAFHASVLRSLSKEVCAVVVQLKGRQPRTVEFTATAADTGGACRVVATDITVRRQTDLAVGASEAKFRALFETATVGICFVDRAGRMIQTNPALRRILHIDDACLRTETYRSRRFLRGNGSPMPSSEFASTRALATGRSAHEVETGVVLEDGTIVWTLVSAACLDLPEASAVVITQDITERRRAMELALENRRNLSRAEHLGGLGNWAWEVAGNTIAWSDALYGIFGVPKDFPLSFASIESLVHPLDRALNSEQVAKLLAGARELDYEFRILRPDGQMRYVRQHVEVESSPVGRAQRAFGVIQDVTERKLAEDRIHRFSRQLLEAREEEKRRLSSALHHDVGSLAVSLMARMDAADDDLRAGDAARAASSLKACRKLFEKAVLNLKTLAAELRPPDLDLLGVRAALRQLCAKISKDTGVLVNFENTSGRRAIPFEVRTVLFRTAQEAITNAVKHAKPKRVQVRLAAPKGGLALTVVDDGKGFDPARVLARPGKRMGLRSMQEMSAALGGESTILSTPGHGASVSIWLPAAWKDGAS